MRPLTHGLATLVAALLLCAAGGCANCRTGIDPTGEQIFAPAPVEYDPEPPGRRMWDNVGLVVTPHESIAPVGSEVVLAASVVGPDRYLTTNERVEWTVAPGGVGEIVQVAEGTWLDLFVLDFTRPHKVSGTWAVGSTSRYYTRLTRGTPAASDDTCVKAGQTWVSVSSPTEGTSYVTAYAPSVYGWDRHRETAVIHWVDAQWAFPPPSINPAGTRHIFTTTVSRHTDQSPCVGWVVRYEIAGGPPAGFAPNAAQAIEVQTNELGQASAEISQVQPGPGTNKINIQVIRPAALDGKEGRRLVLATGSTLKTWSAPQIAVRKTGPAAVVVGAALRYVIEVTNPGDLPADGVAVADQVPEGTALLSTNPPAQIAGGTLQWQLGKIPGFQTRRLEVNLRADKLGGLTSCAEAVAAGGLRARDCVTTTVTTPGVDLKVTSPPQVAVGDEVTFEILLTNRSAVTLTGLLIKDRFEAGLEHKVASGAIDRPLADLPPGGSHKIHVTFRAVKAGRLCHTVEITGSSGGLAKQQACVTAVERPAQPKAPVGSAPGAPAAKPELSLRASAPASATVGETVLLSIELANATSARLTNVRLVDNYDPAMKPLVATDGFYKDEPNRLVAITIDAMPPGTMAKLQVSFACQQEAAQACNRLSVTTAEGVTAKAEACVAIRAGQPTPPAPGVGPGTGNLAIEATDSTDPVNVGGSVTYRITVTNRGQTADRNVKMAAAIPTQMVPDPLGISGPPGPGGPVKGTIEGQIVAFDPVAVLEPGKSLTYRIKAQARTSTSPNAPARIAAQVTSDSVREPKIVEETTLINPKAP
jgi:uncharacterized repeat protein (TIGR01451 family)